jgi:hypothetical protein
LLRCDLSRLGCLGGAPGLALRGEPGTLLLERDARRPDVTAGRAGDGLLLAQARSLTGP